LPGDQAAIYLDPQRSAGAMDFRTLLQRSLWIMLLVGILTVIGTLAFLQFPGWTLSDALYMTIITLSAVGYDEVRPLNDQGRFLAALLLAGGITSMGLWFALITSAMVEMDLTNVIRLRKTRRKMMQLKDHIIICGAGRMGLQVIRELIHAGVPYVVIEQDPDRAHEIRSMRDDMLVVEADATRDESLDEALIWTARGLIAALPDDMANLFVCLSAKGLRPDLEVVRMASILLRPQVVSFLDVVTGDEELRLRLEELAVPANSPLAGQTLAEAQIPLKTGLIVIAITHAGDDGAFIYNPGPDEQIRANDVLIVLGGPEQIDSLQEAARA
jgi:voltage-gated potassium channel